MRSWRWWPAVWLGALVAIAVWGEVDSLKRPQPVGQNERPAKSLAPRATATEKPDDRIADYTLWLERYTGALTLATLALWIEARFSARASGKAARRQDRAYVSATLEFFFAFTAGDRPRARWTMKNHGSTPAHDLVTRANIALIPFPLRPGYSLPPLTDHKLQSPSVLFPSANTQVTVTGVDKASVAGIDSLRNGSSVLCIYGELFYLDIFYERRTTTFCSYVQPDLDMLKKLTSAYEASDLKVNFVIAPMGNTYT
jgi:hypothetical protein